MIMRPIRLPVNQEIVGNTDCSDYPGLVRVRYTEPPMRGLDELRVMLIDQAV